MNAVSSLSRSSSLTRSISLNSSHDWEGWIGVQEPDAELPEPDYSHVEEASPPLKPVKDSHAPRTDVTAEEFVLQALGLSFSMAEGDPTKRITGVHGSASVAGVHECDELVAINGVDVSGDDVNGFDCIEMCKQAARESSHVTLVIRDFVTMREKEVEVETSESCPAMRLVRERFASPRSSSSRRNTPSKSDLPYMDSDRDLYGSSSTNSSELPPADRPLDGDQDSPGGFTWTFPTVWSWKFAMLVGLSGMLTVLVCSLLDSKLVVEFIATIDRLEGWLQNIPLCSCTYYIRGSTVSVPLCRACKPKVLRYLDFDSNVGVALERRRLCDVRPFWLMGKCHRSTETVKYLGTFATYDECEAACLSYNVGKSKCRSVTYHLRSYRERKFRQTCFAVVHSGWAKVRQFGVCTGRVFGPLLQLQRMLQWCRHQLNKRILLGWWYDGQPWEVGMTLVLVIFGLSGVRRTPSVHLTEEELDL